MNHPKFYTNLFIITTMFNLSIIPFIYYDYNLLYVGIFGSAFIINLMLANDIYFLYDIN
jgi:hypothetical protein